MEIGNRIRELRQKHNWNQEEFADKMFVTRQTISNWENSKSYPDIQSLVLMGEVFDISIDDLLKGDVEEMKTIINEEEVKEFNKYGKLLTIGFILLMVLPVPMVVFMGYYGFIPYAILFVWVSYVANKVEKIKKNNDIQTYKEIIAFDKGESLDEITKEREKAIRPYQKFLLVLGSALVALCVCGIIILIMHLLKLI